VRSFVPSTLDVDGPLRCGDVPESYSLYNTLDDGREVS